MMAKNGIDNNLIKISINSKNYEGKLNSHFESKTIQVKELPEIVKSNNFSLITWKDGTRKANNFVSASGFTVDVDKNLRLDEAKKRLDDGGFNYIFASSKSHTTEENRYHIILLFSNSVYSKKAYKAINGEICSKLFPESDTSVDDAGRFIFGSPDDAIIKWKFDGKNFNVLAHDGLWTSTTEITTEDNEAVTIKDIDKANKVPCYCPFHDDSNSSAFVMYNEASDNWRISCSTCGETVWMEKDKGQLDEKLLDFFHYSTNIIEIGLASGDFYMHPIDKEAFHIRTFTDGKKEVRSEAYKSLVNKKHIRHMARVDFIGNVNTNEDYYQMNIEDGVVTVHYSPVATVIEDNDFIEKYLDDRFREHKEFIKRFLAAYCYTNYVQLPTLIFNSPRGNGKTTFINLIKSIYPHLSVDWRGVENDFTYEAEKKLLIVEENDNKGDKQYKTLKKYTGEKDAQVRKKYQAPYTVRNNMNIVILSNEKVPMIAKHSELPLDEANNQFFVWEFPEFTTPLYNGIADELEARIGYYIRTELKDVFDSIKNDMKINRYYISVPITEHEKRMFKSSKTPVELDTDEIIEFVCHLEENGQYNEYYEFVSDGYLPQEIIKSRVNLNHHLIFKNLIEREYILGDTDRPMKNGKQYRCYYMDKKFRDEFNKAQKN